MLQALRRHQTSERGAAAVELALILPLLMLLLFGIIEFGRFYSMQVALTGAAREGAREMAISNDWSVAQARTITAATGLNPPAAVAGALNVSRTPASCSPGNDIRVTATRQYNFPLLAAMGPRQITGTGVMRCGG